MRKRKYWVPIIIGFVITGILFLTQRLWNPLDLKSYDIRFQISELLGIGQVQTSGRIVVVGIDERKLLSEKPLMFLYPDIGNFINKMSDYKVSVIGLDIIPIHEQSEKFKKSVLSLYDKTPQAYISFIEKTGRKLDNSLLEPIIRVSRDIPVVQAYHESLTPFYYGLVPFMGNVHLSDIVLTDGDTTRNDGIIRRQELLPGNKESFAFTIVRLLDHQSPPSASVNLNFFLLKNIPIFCFEDVMHGKVGQDAFRGKAVILGYISPHEDVHQTPLSNYRLSSCGGAMPEKIALQRKVRIPGSLIHAVAAETLLTKTFLKDLGMTIKAALLIILGLTGISIALKMKPQYGISATFLLMCIYFACSVFFFSRGHIIPLFPHILAPFLVTAFIYPYHYIIEERDKRRLYKTFGYYVDKEVIDSLIDRDPENLLKGEYRDASILFLDIRDFTMLSMNHKAQDIVSLLNLYFGTITDIVKHHGGFVNKFIGDGVLAFFAGEENPVSSTIQSALEILHETQRLNDEGVLTPFIGDTKLFIGIGIHYGKVVMGNIGSEKKMDFTIMGANVNIASRIEGLTKQLKKPVLLSASAYNMLKDEYCFEDLGTQEVNNE
ncbi:MAG: adenylate/guanylate cyclase domain-containing protein [Proteobacteria bacterium]|nr:adenylate/guanylate cyclase domain-containing protein [Pseudomonadota bacterium]